MPASIERMHQLTREFFARHWAMGEIPGAPPEWSAPWRFRGPLPNADRQGVWALLRGDEVVYIGAGAGRQASTDLEQGLRGTLRPKGRKRASAPGERQYDLAQRWAERGVDALITLGFPEKYAYLALACEAFLLGDLRPEFNRERTAPR